MGNQDFTVVVLCSTISVFLAYNTFQYWRLVQKPLIVYGSKQSEKLVQQCPTLNSHYYPFYFAWGRHSQLILSAIHFYYQRYTRPIQWKSEIFVMEDGQEITVDWAMSQDAKAESGLNASLKDTPILIIQHGALCNSKNLPSQDWISDAHKRGWIVCCQHRRGTKMNLTVPQINFFGSTSDVKYLLTNYILKRRPNAQILMIGISAGSGLLVRFLGEEGNSQLITAAMGLCAGYNITVSMKRIEKIYANYLLNGVQNVYLRKNKLLLQSIEGYDKCLEASNLQQFLDHSYALAGYESTADYYKNCNPMEVVNNITTPSLFINSEDDPICVYKNVDEHIHVFQQSQYSILATTKTGTHCAFWEKLSTKSWAEKATYEFFDACLKQ